MVKTTDIFSSFLCAWKDVYGGTDTYGCYISILFGMYLYKHTHIWVLISLFACFHMYILSFQCYCGCVPVHQNVTLLKGNNVNKHISFRPANHD